MKQLRQGNLLVPVLVGVAVGVTSTLVAARARRRPGKPGRWDERRVDAYTAYADIVKKMIYTTMQVAAGRGISLSAQPMPLDEGLRDLGNLEEERSLRWETMLLLAGPATGKAARVWHRHVWRLEQIACGIDVDAAEWNRTMSEAIEARERFYNEARRELVIEGDTLTDEQPPWTPRDTELPQLVSPDPVP
ncbi:hypothetical protein [Longispora urticae]